MAKTVLIVHSARRAGMSRAMETACDELRARGFEVLEVEGRDEDDVLSSMRATVRLFQTPASPAPETRTAAPRCLTRGHVRGACGPKCLCSDPNCIGEPETRTGEGAHPLSAFVYVPGKPTGRCDLSRWGREHEHNETKACVRFAPSPREGTP